MTISVIPAREQKQVRRVSAYIRTSSLNDNQAESFAAQRDVYMRMIEERPDWVLHKLYSDRGISGTRAALRPGFLEMIADGEAEQYDVLLVKSISRFSRHAGETQLYVDILRSHHIEIIFEKENLSSNDYTSNLALALHGIFSQSESQSIGQNVSLAYQARCARGEYNLGNNRILGYDTVKKKLVPNQDTWIIREIFDRYVRGENCSSIASGLNAKGARTLHNHCFKAEAVKNILKNETYVGDKHLIKNPPRDYISHKPDKYATYTDYYLSDDHEPVISREVWEKTQQKLQEAADERSGGIYRVSGCHYLYGIVFCGDCGSPFRRRTVRHGRGNYHKAWTCRERLKGAVGNGCRCRTVSEKDILDAVSRITGIDKDDKIRVLSVVRKIVITDSEVVVQMT